MKGYGVRNASDPSPITENTLFVIGSCSKAFTAFALGQLVTATVAGQPSCKMKPEKKNLFSIEELPGCSIQFVMGANQLVSELQLTQAGHIFSLKARSSV